MRDRDADRSTCRRAWPTARGSACRARATPGRNGGEHGRSATSPSTSSRIRCSGARATTCTSSVPIAVHEAALGARIEVPSLDGPARLRVPPGTQSGQRFRLRERGVPSPRDGRRGDLVVEVRLVLPKVLDERSKELLREFGRINGEDVREASCEQLRTVGDRRCHEEDAARRTT